MWLTDKLGPLPRWAWVGSGVAVAVGFTYWRRRSGSTATQVALAPDTAGTGVSDVSGLVGAQQPVGVPAQVVTSPQGVGALPNQTTAQADQPKNGQGKSKKSQGKAAVVRSSQPAPSTQQAVHPVPVYQPGVTQPVRGGVVQYDKPIGPTAPAPETRRGSRATRVNRGD